MTRRSLGSRPRSRAAIYFMLIIMTVLLVGILFGGDRFAEGIASMFAAPESQEIQLPPKLEKQPTLGEHVQLMMRDAIQITRKPIERHRNAQP